MKNKKRAAILFSVIAILAGIVIMFVSFAMTGFDFKAYDKREIVTTEYEFDFAPLNSLYIKSDSMDVDVVVSQSATKATVSITHDSEIMPTATHDGKTLTVISDESSGLSEWVGMFGINLNNERKIVVTLPFGVYDDLKIEAKTMDVSINGAKSAFNTADIDLTTGDLDISNLNAGTMNVDLTTGGANFSSVGAKSLTVNATTGNYNLNTVIADSVKFTATTGDLKLNAVTADTVDIEMSTGDTEIKATLASTINIKATTGDVDIKLSDAEEINVEVTTGDVDALLLTGKDYKVKTTTGDVDLNGEDTTGGVFNVKTTTGDIEISVAKR